MVHTSYTSSFRKKDTFMEMSWEEFLNICKDLGFREGNKYEFTDHDYGYECEEVILYDEEKGLVLYANSVGEKLNTAEVYGVVKVDPKLAVSGMINREMQGVEFFRSNKDELTYSISFDAREGLATKINKLSKYGCAFKPQWDEMPPVYFLNSEEKAKLPDDSVDEDVDMLNLEKISKLDPKILKIMNYVIPKTPTFPNIIGDTYYLMPWDRFLQFCFDMGFQACYRQNINNIDEEKNDEEIILILPDMGLVLCANSSRARLKSAMLYGNVKAGAISNWNKTGFVPISANDNAVAVRLDARKDLVKKIDDVLNIAGRDIFDMPWHEYQPIYLLNPRDQDDMLNNSLTPEEIMTIKLAKASEELSSIMGISNPSPHNTKT